MSLSKGAIIQQWRAEACKTAKLARRLRDANPVLWSAVNRDGTADRWLAFHEDFNAWVCRQKHPA